MRNFQLLAQNIVVAPLLHAIQRQPELWDENKLRTTHPQSPHTEVSDIWLRFNDLKSYQATGDAKNVIDEHESFNYPALLKLPQVRPIIYDLMRFVEGERLGRVLITRMAPGKEIAPHEDGGAHAAYYDRYHVTLQNGPGSNFYCGNEEVCMLPGEVWWFDNSVTHSVVNNSKDDRLTLIIDIRTPR